MQLPNTRKLFVFPAQSYAMIEFKNWKDKIEHGFVYKRLVVAHRKIRKSPSKTIRNDFLKMVIEQYNSSKVTFQLELLQLHQEVDNYKCEDNFNVDHANYKNYHSSNYTSEGMC